MPRLPSPRLGPRPGRRLGCRRRAPAAPDRGRCGRRRSPAQSPRDARPRRPRALPQRPLRVCRIYSQSSGRLEEYGRIGLPFQAQLTGLDPIDLRVEEVGDSRRLERVNAVTRCGNYCRSTVAGSKPVQEPDRGGVGPDALSPKPFEEQLTLPIVQSTGRLGTGRIARVTPRQRDAARGEKRLHSVVPRLSVDIEVVVVGRKRSVVLIPTLWSVSQEPVEHPLPGRGVDRSRVGDDAVEIEEHGIDAIHPGLNSHAATICPSAVPTTPRLVRPPRRRVPSGESLLVVDQARPGA
jgi:hypothetical protein